MVEKVITSARMTSARNVVDLARYQSDRSASGRALAMSARLCRHCGAALSDGEREEECSSATNTVNPERLRWQAAQILRGLI
jgi:hypothetical protein